MEIVDYSDKSFVVRGDKSKEYKDRLKELGGRWNYGLQGGGGWIFGLKKRKEVEALVEEVNLGPIGTKLQTVWYTVENPSSATKVRLTLNKDTDDMVESIVNIKSMDPLDGKIQNVNLEDGRQIVVVNGEWRVWGEDDYVEFI